MVVPDDVSIDEFVKFRSRTTKEAYELDDQGMILTEKAGNCLAFGRRFCGDDRRAQRCKDFDQQNM